MRNPVNFSQTERLDWPATLTGEMPFLGLLGKIIYSEPEEAWIKPLMEVDLFSGVRLGMDEEENQLGLKLLNQWMRGQNGSFPRSKLTRYYGIARTSATSSGFEPTHQAARYSASQKNQSFMETKPKGDKKKHLDFKK